MQKKTQNSAENYQNIRVFAVFCLFPEVIQD